MAISYNQLDTKRKLTGTTFNLMQGTTGDHPASLGALLFQLWEFVKLIDNKWMALLEESSFQTAREIFLERKRACVPYVSLLVIPTYKLSL